MAGADGISDEARGELQGAISFYEELETDVEFRFLPERAVCCENDDESRRFIAGGARGPYIWLNSALSAPDLGVTAWHEAQHVLIPGQRSAEHGIIYPRQGQIYLGLPTSLQGQAVQTGRLLKRRGIIR